MRPPKLYATCLLWLLSELFEELPEVGDPDKPKLVFFFDEAHLLFDEAPKALIQKVEQVVRLIRSKGIGVYFVTQNPLDVPDTVSGQLGNRIQHALRAFTPREQRAVKAAAETFRPNPDLDTQAVIMELGIGEALVSTLEKKGRPSIVQRTLIRPPSSRLGPLKEDERADVMKNSPVHGLYDEGEDRTSAYEILKKRKADIEARAAKEVEKEGGYERHGSFRVPKAPKGGRTRRTSRRSSSRRQTTTEAFTKSMLRSLGSSLGRVLGRAIRGALRGR
ncbi:hypothetical protein MnTg02_01450 [bacterium MnTg02]|nr:hypothetical protein MnTg02_01450 [bacterium MnTg02]